MVVSPNGELLEEAKMIDYSRQQIKPWGKQWMFVCWDCSNQSWMPIGTLKHCQKIMDGHLDSPRHLRQMELKAKAKASEQSVYLPSFSFGGN